MTDGILQEEREETVILRGMKTSKVTAWKWVSFMVQKSGILSEPLPMKSGLILNTWGKIRMFKDHTFIDLPKDMPREIFEALKTVWVQGHQMNISVDKGRPRPGGAGW